MYEIHELLGGLVGLSSIILFIIFIFGLILLFFLPFFVYRIRNEMIRLNNNVLTLIDTVANISEFLTIRGDISNPGD